MYRNVTNTLLSGPVFEVLALLSFILLLAGAY